MNQHRHINRNNNFLVKYQNILPFVGISLVLLAVFLFNCFYIIDAGQRGVILRFGAISNQVGEGFHFKIPMVDQVVKIDVRIRKAVTKTTSSSKDLQEVTSEIALNYHLNPESVSKIYKEIGLNWEISIIDPAVRETMKAITAQYTAEELITNRSSVSNAIKESLSDSLTKYGLIVDEISITDFSFSDEFDRAIESKQTAEQMALKAERDLDRIKIEAEQKIAAAKAEAEALRLQKQEVTIELLRLREIEVQRQAVEKWDGKLPSVTGGATPFISVSPVKN
jgi:regulator of protease activity HflC (stomatin/prohibitin superfamily)